MMNSGTMLQMLLAAALAAVCGCSGGDSHASSNELERLRFELEKVRSEQRALRSEVAALRELLSRLPSRAAPVKEATFKSDGSEKNDPYRGREDAPVTVMAFTDFQCKPCRDFAKRTLPQLESDFIGPGAVKFILRDYPLPSNPNSRQAAVVAHCAGEQGKYWLMHDLLFAHADDVDAGRWDKIFEAASELDREKLQRCAGSGRYEAEINADIEAGKLLGAKGAPGFFIGKRETDETWRGVFARGAQPFLLFAAQIRQLLGSRPPGAETSAADNL